MNDSLSMTQGLISRAAEGDAAARQELLERYRDYLRRMVEVRLDRRLASRVDASDVVQETLIEASRRLDDYLRERPLPFFGWLRQLAGERMIDVHRRHVISQRRSVMVEHRDLGLRDASADELVRRLLAGDTSPSHHVIRKEQHELLREALAALTERDREIVVMRHLERLSTAEISAALDLSESAVKSRLLRALLRMRQKLSDSI
jgi:RNA polymerase sigma-70 factor (ECF subfamily)